MRPIVQDVDFLFIYEVRNREIDSICLLGAWLEEQGYTVAYINSWDTMYHWNPEYRAKVAVISACYSDGTYAFFTGHALHFDKVVNLMRRAVVVGDDGREEVVGRYDDFIAHFTEGAYAKIDRRYFQILWRALKSAPKQTLSSIDIDPFAKLAKGSQMEVLRQYAAENAACSLDSPFARVFFNLFGGRQTGVGDDVTGEEEE